MVVGLPLLAAVRRQRSAAPGRCVSARLRQLVLAELADAVERLSRPDLAALSADHHRGWRARLWAHLARSVHELVRPARHQLPALRVGAVRLRSAVVDHRLEWHANSGWRSRRSSRQGGLLNTTA